MSLFSRLFGRGEPEKPIEEMSIPEIAEFLQRMSEPMPAKELIHVARRVADIALFERDVPERERAVALNLLPALDADIEAGLAAQPGAVEAYRDAVLVHRGAARHYGFGSLQWLMDERAMQPAEVIPFLARVEHAELLPAYLEMLEPEVIHEIRGTLLQEMSAARGRDGERPIDALSRLATNGDGALTMLLDGRQLGALVRARVHPEAAHAMLAELGVSQ
jgi:hypothetical protein